MSFEKLLLACMSAKKFLYSVVTDHRALLKFIKINTNQLIKSSQKKKKRENL